MTTQNHTIDWAVAIPEHRGWMLRLACARLGDRHAAEDVVQEIVLGVVRSDPGLDGTDCVRPWLYQAVIRRTADHLRGRYRQQRLKESVSHMQQQAGNEMDLQDGLQWILAIEQRSLLERALKQLSKEDREILLLKFAQNWSYKKLSERFQIPERAVEYKLVRIKRQLRSEMVLHMGEDHV